MPNEITGSKRIEMTELMEKSVLLSEYDEDTQREYLVSLAHMYKDAEVGSAKFKEICQGRAEGPASRNELFSTCGEFIMFLLERYGYRGRILNRDLTDQHGTKQRSWVTGKNIEYIFSRGRKDGKFVEYLLSKLKSKRPSPGDVVYISDQVNPNTEHVFMFESLYAGPASHYDPKYELWISIDGGQGGNKNQHIAECRRLFDTTNGKVYDIIEYATGRYRPKGMGRHVIGWLNTVLLEVTAEANLIVPQV